MNRPELASHRHRKAQPEVSPARPAATRQRLTSGRTHGTFHLEGGIYSLSDLEVAQMDSPMQHLALEPMEAIGMQPPSAASVSTRDASGSD